MSTSCIRGVLLQASNSKPVFGACVLILFFLLTTTFVFLTKFEKFREYLLLEVNRWESPS